MERRASRLAVAITALLVVVMAGRALRRPGAISYAPTDAGNLSKADHLAKLGNWDAAGPIYARLESRFEQKHDARDALYAHVSRYGLEEESSDLQSVSQELKTTLKLPLVQNDLQLKQRCLEIKAHVDLNLDGVSARPSLEELEQVAAQRHDTDAASRASGEIGILAFLEGNPKEARNRVLASIAAAELSGDTGAQIRYLSLLGQGLAESHKPYEALWPLDHALSIAEDTPETGFPKLALSGKASALTQLGRFHEAQATIDEGLRYARGHRYIGFEVDMLAQSGQLAEAQNQLANAISFYEKAASLAKQVGFNRGLAEVNAQLASLYRRSGMLPQAVAAEQASLEAHLKIGEVYELPHHLALKAELQRAMGMLGAAKRTYDAAEQIVGTMLKNSPTAGIKRSVIASMSEIYLGHFHLELEERNVPGAYAVIEEARGRVEADRLQSPNQDARPLPAIAAAERKIAFLQVQLFASEDQSERNRLSDAITALEDQTPFEEPSPLAGHLLSLMDLQETLLSNEVVLEYVLDEPTSYCLVIRRNGVSAVPLAGRKSIAKLVDNDLAAIKAKSLAVEEGRALYAALIEPVSSHIETANLIVVPDGEFNYVSFAALVDTQNRYLVESRSVDYAPSGTVLALLRRRCERRKRELLAVGNVAYGEEAEPVQHGLFFRGLESLTRRTLQSLPATEEEVRSVAGTLSDFTEVVLAGRTATESNFKREAAKGPDVIHLALHAFADKSYPDRAGLVFAADDSGEDGVLQVREIRRLPLAHTSLVTLSACDTSAGRVEGEEGVSSIVSAFLYAGSRTALSSFWSIEDSSTSELMKLFYGSLARGNSKSAALRSAQLELLRRGGETKSPFFWAAFGLLGDGSGTIEDRTSR